MSHAIVIGIDRYADPTLNLTGAVRDAIGFAKWATTIGGVPPENVSLLLSADTAVLARLAGTPLAGRQRGATWDDITDTLIAAQSSQRGQRLLFFYAGHAVHPPGATARTYPIILPSN